MLIPDTNLLATVLTLELKLRCELCKWNVKIPLIKYLCYCSLKLLSCSTCCHTLLAFSTHIESSNNNFRGGGRSLHGLPTSLCPEGTGDHFPWGGVGGGDFGQIMISTTSVHKIGSLRIYLYSIACIKPQWCLF